jgi:hypothetical protein
MEGLMKGTPTKRSMQQRVQHGSAMKHTFEKNSSVDSSEDTSVQQWKEYATRHNTTH